MRDEFGSTFVSIGVMVIMALLWMWFSSASCTNRWEGSNLKSKWGLTTGCMVKVPSGIWLPADSIREIDITPKKEETK